MIRADKPFTKGKKAVPGGDRQPPMDLASDDFEEPNLKRPRPQPINEDKENKVNLEEKDKEEQIEDDTEESGEDDVYVSWDEFHTQSRFVGQ